MPPLPLRWVCRCSIIAAALLGLVSWLIFCNAAHDASHGALHKKAWMNTLFHFSAAPFQAGQCTWWLQHVVSHHQFTNVVGHDVDAHHQCFARWHRAVPHEIRGALHTVTHRYPPRSTAQDSRCTALAMHTHPAQPPRTPNPSLRPALCLPHTRFTPTTVAGSRVPCVAGGRWCGGIHNLFWHFLTYLGATVGMSIIHPLKFLWLPLINHLFMGGAPLR